MGCKVKEPGIIQGRVRIGSTSVENKVATISEEFVVVPGGWALVGGWKQFVPLEGGGVPDPNAGFMVHKLGLFIAATKDSELMALDAGRVSSAWTWELVILVTADCRIAGIFRVEFLSSSRG